MAQLRLKPRSPGVTLLGFLVRLQIIFCISFLKIVWLKPLPVWAFLGPVLHAIMLSSQRWAASGLGLSFLFLRHEVDQIWTPREWDSSLAGSMSRWISSTMSMSLLRVTFRLPSPSHDRDLTAFFICYWVSRWLAGGCKGKLLLGNCPEILFFALLLP